MITPGSGGWRGMGQSPLQHLSKICTGMIITQKACLCNLQSIDWSSWWHLTLLESSRVSVSSIVSAMSHSYSECLDNVLKYTQIETLILQKLSNVWAQFHKNLWEHEAGKLGYTNPPSQDTPKSYYWHGPIINNFLIFFFLFVAFPWWKLCT